MYERLLDKKNQPTPEHVKEYIGDKSFKHLLLLEEYLQAHYQLSKEMRFPFGNDYGWGYKYNHKSTHLCYAFFERGAFTVTLQIGDKQAHFVDDIINTLSSKAVELWKNRYPCGDKGGWVHYRVLSDEELGDVYKLLHAKKRPALTK